MDVICSGPGPHIPPSGVLGTSLREVTGMRCSSPNCAQTSSQWDVNEATLGARVRAALAANATDLTQAGTVWDGANTIANGTGTMTTAQLTTAVRSLAAGLRVLAAHDQAQIRQLNALIRLVARQLGDVSDT